MFLCSWRIAFGHVSDRLRTCPILDKSEGDPLFGDHFRTICASSPLLSSPLLSCGLAFLLFSSPLSSPRSSPLRGGGRPSTTACPNQASGKRSCRECQNTCNPTRNRCVDQNRNYSGIYASASDRYLISSEFAGISERGGVRLLWDSRAMECEAPKRRAMNSSGVNGRGG